MNIVSSKPTITRKELEGVLDCLINDELTLGNTIKNFEKSFSELVGVKFSCAVSSHTAAYHLALEAMDIQPDDEIIMPSYFHYSVMNALQFKKAKPILIDVEENSLFITIEKIKEKITPHTKAIVVGYLCGFLENYDELKNLNIPIIEDISHSLGAEMNEKPIGNIGSIVIASLSPFDIITTGMGGMLITNNTRYYSIIKEKRYNKTGLHYDYKMTDFQAAIGISQLTRLQDFIKRRREIVKYYFERIKITSHKPLMPYNESFVYQSFPILFDSPSDKIEPYFKKNGISVSRPIKNALHNLNDSNGSDFPNSERLLKKMYCLPVYPTLSGKEIEKIGRTLAKFI